MWIRLLFRADDECGSTMWCGPNDGARRGDRAGSGDEDARPNEGVTPAGSGVPGGEDEWSGHPTADPSALAGGPVSGSKGIAEIGRSGDIEDLTVLDATDPSLGLTNVGEAPADDWAADTGPTRTGEAAPHGVSRELVDQDRSLAGRVIDFEKAGARKAGATTQNSKPSRNRRKRS
jgi:hypothetical protein